MALSWVRRPTYPEVALQTILGFLLVILLFDYFQALGAEPCHPPTPRDCYPWGAEGPAAEFWYYASKEIYLKHALTSSLVLATAILAPFSARGRGSGLAAMFGILIVGTMGSNWLEI